MGTFGVELYDRAGGPLAALGDVRLTPQPWGGAARGGPKRAEIEATGSRAALKDMLLNWLRYRVVITTPSAGSCWWGYIHEISLTLDGVEYTASLDGLRNRIAVTYTSVEGAIEGAYTTAWAEDAGSQGQFGVKEHFESLGQATAAMAAAYRDRMLARYAYPLLGRGLAGGGGAVGSVGSTGGADRGRVVLRCRGWGELFGWRYYRRTDGRLEHMPSDTQAQPIGWGIAASNQVGFGDGAIHDAWGRLGSLKAGMKLTTSGAANGGNNRTWTALDSSGEKVESYANNSIYFEPTDDILDALGGMGMVKTGHWLLVTGSAANSRWHRIGSAAADHLRTSASVSGAIAAEGTGPSISMYQAQRLSTVEGATYEAPGSANVTIQHHGQQVAQRVTLATAMKIDRVMIEAAKVGNPGGNLVVRIHADSSGAVGSQLTTGGLAALALTDDLNVVSVPVTEITLSPGSYWIVVRRADSNDGANYYLVGMTQTAYGSCQMWTGSAWVAHAPGWFLKFRLWAVEDTGTMAETMLQATAQVVTVQGGFLSGVNGYPTMDGQATALDELTRLAGVGMSDGSRVLWDISPDLQMRLVAQPQAGMSPTLSLRTAGGKVRLFDAAGSPWLAGVLPVGMWAELADMDSDLQAVGGLSPAFIEEATYDPQADSWDILFEGERSLLDMLKVQAG